MVSDYLSCCLKLKAKLKDILDIEDFNINHFIFIL